MTQTPNSNADQLTNRIARFIVETDARALPAEVMAGARNALMDTVGVGLIGSREPVSTIAQQLVTEIGAKPRATLWGTPLRSSPFEAAYANGICAHALDFDDSHSSVRGHASAPTIATVLAIGESVWRSLANSAVPWGPATICAAGKQRPPSALSARQRQRGACGISMCRRCARRCRSRPRN